MSDNTQLSTPRAYSLATQAQAHFLFVHKGLPLAEIADTLKINYHSLTGWIQRHNWTSAREKAFSESFSSENASAYVKAELESIATRSSELASRTLELASEAIDARDAKNLMYSASALKTLTDVASKGVGIDSVKPSSVSVTFSLADLYQVSPNPKQVSEASSASASLSLQLPSPA